MKTSLSAALLALLVLAPLTLAGEPAPNTLTEQEKAAGWTLLFDGQTTEGWRNYKKDDINQGWKIIDGVLQRAEKGAGDIITNDQYGAFELSLEYRISKAGNSGIMYHVLETENAPWQTGPEIQVQDNKDGHDPQKAGWLYQLTSRRRTPRSQWASGIRSASSSRRKSVCRP